MKKLLQSTLCIALAATILQLQSCSKIKDAIKIDPVSFSGSGDIVIPASAAGSSGDLASTKVSYNIDSMIKEQTKSSPISISYKDIKSVKISSVVLTLSDADATNSFGNFQTAGASFNTDANGGSLDPYIVAYIDPNPSTFASSLNLPLVDKDKDLKQYFGAGNVNFAYVVTGTLRTATTHDLHCHIDITYELGF